MIKGLVEAIPISIETTAIHWKAIPIFEHNNIRNILVNGKNFSILVIPADEGISFINNYLGDACIHRHDMKN